MYLLAILLPPVAVWMAGKPFQALLALFLWMCLILPGAIYAVLVVSEYKSAQNTDRLILALRRSSPASASDGGPGSDFNFG